MSSAAAETKMINLSSSDNETFQLEEEVAKQSETIKHLIEDDCADSTIPIPNVTGKILALVIEYCKRHAHSPKAADDDHQAPTRDETDALKKFDEEFVQVDRNTIFELILAANYLNIKSLLDLTCQRVADKIKDKSVEEIRRIFNIQNDFTPEEEAEVRRENSWAFE